MKFHLLIFFLIFSVCCMDSTHCQIKYPTIEIADESQLRAEIKNLLKNEYIEDVSKPVRMAFTFKIDSLGEVHSAHINWNLNLKPTSLYLICYEIEKKFNLNFFYHKFKKDFIGLKYCHVTFSYFSDRDQDR